MENNILLPIHKAKSIARLASRMTRRAVNQARDAQFLIDLLNLPDDLNGLKDCDES